jgi:uncharacterized membrane protein
VITDLVTVLVLTASGVTAGVLFGVAISLLPALLVMPNDVYVYSHELIGRHWDPTMPVIVLSAMAGDIALAVMAPQQTLLFVIAAVLLFGVSVVSHLCNVPINRAVKALADKEIPAGWRDPRPEWRRWHLIRTALAVVAIVVNAFAVIQAR